MILNGEKIKNRNSLSQKIKRNDVISLIDDKNELNEWFNLNFTNIDKKIIFLNIIKQYNKKNSVVLFFNSNEFESFPIERFNLYMEHINKNPKDSISLNYFKLRYGDNYQEIFNESKNKKKTTLENFIKKYGENGEIKWNELINKQKKSSKRSIDYWIIECENDIDLAKSKLKEYQLSHREKFIKNKSKEEIKNHDLQGSPWRIEYYLYRGYSEKEGKEIISKMKKESSMFCKEYYLKNNYNLDESKSLSYEYWKKNCYNNSLNISKESLKIFKPLYDDLKLKYDNILIYFGDSENNKKEYFLYDKENKKYYFYDFTILYKGIKLIIEYQGHMFHPNREKLNENDWNNWICLFKNIDADQKYKMDNLKKELAINNGFEYLEIWSNDSNDINIKKVKNFLKQNFNIC